MKSLRRSAVLAAALACALAGCQRTEEDRPAPQASVIAAPPGSGYAKDIENLCDAMSRSGADKLDKSEHAMHIATWLAANLTTSEARQFLVKIQPLVGTDKADALEAEAKKVGLKGCALAAPWREPGAVPMP